MVFSNFSHQWVRKMRLSAAAESPSALTAPSYNRLSITKAGGTPG